MDDDESPRTTDARPEGATAPRTYLFTLTNAGGTVPPEMGVVRRLVERGHRATVVADESIADQVRRSGAVHLPATPNPAPELRDWELRSPMSIARATTDSLMTAPAPGQAADTIAAIDAIRPDLVVASSLALGAMIGAEARRVPFDILIPNAYPLPAKGMPPFGTGMSPARGPLGRARDRLARGASTRLIDRFALAKTNALRAEHGLVPIAHTWDQMGRARRQLVLTSSAFDFPAELPANARYVGPILDDPAWAVGEAWTSRRGDGRLVLVAMSSTFQDHVDCLQRITDAVGSLPVHGLVTTGPAVEPGAIHAPANVAVVASAPHRLVLPHADLVVTHGGHGTVIKALAAGVPLVVLHHGRDQADNAVRVTARGAGIAVRRTASASRIAMAITDVLGDPSYRKSAQRMGEAITRDVESGALVAELEGI
ncbi:glycosyltransferase [Agromyces sp. SYSU K20354]|uniref:glycosyltransferase n=1 Tax=Agromyces cavernae TaxID=2898659 RepID=UPI001E39E952|nr:glycosyltransferase [Agromyces cavernae]MCD2443096.1 glycosyltransferase [Agromyces cavernae]